MEINNKLKMAIVVGTCGVTQYMHADIPCEVGVPLDDWMKRTPVAKIHSTETRIHVIQKDEKPVLIGTITIVYEEPPES